MKSLSPILNTARSMATALRLTALIAAAGPVFLTCQAQVTNSMPATKRERMQTEVKDVLEQLHLTDDQKPKVEAILRESFEKRRTVLEKYRGQRGFRALRSARKELDPIKKDTDAQLKVVLTPSQMKEFEKQREKLRKEWIAEWREERRKSQ